MTQLTTQDQATALEQVVIGGDLSKLSAADRVQYYNQVCNSLGLNPLTKPFQYIVLNDRLTLYATRDCADQLRKRDGISVHVTSREVVDGIYVVTAEGSTPDGRVDTSIGAVPLIKANGTWRDAANGKRYFNPDGTFSELAPEDRANAMMKAETKAKRRATLSICGLGWLDETETESISDARPVTVDTETGEIVDRYADIYAALESFTTRAEIDRLHGTLSAAEKSDATVRAAFNTAARRVQV